MYPDGVLAKWQLAVNYAGQGRYAEAIAAFLSRKLPTANTNWSLGYAYGRAGNKQEALKIAHYLIERRKQRYLWPSIVAVVYIGMDDKDKAFEWLEKGYQERDFWVFQLQTDFRFDPIRSDPRYRDLLRRINFPK